MSDALGTSSNQTRNEQSDVDEGNNCRETATHPDCSAGCRCGGADKHNKRLGDRRDGLFHPPANACDMQHIVRAKCHEQQTLDKSRHNNEKKAAECGDMG